MTEFVLPELGENVAGGDVLRVLVKPGDTLLRDQPVLELETDKATIEVPSSVEGRVKDLRVAEGQRLKVGDVVLTVEGDGGKAATPPPSTAQRAAPPPAPSPAPDEDVETDTSPTETAERVAAPEAPADNRAGRSQTAAAAGGRIEFPLPALGENVTGGDVLHVLVKPGDVVQQDQALLELETDKATVEVPSSVEGRIVEVRIKDGDRVQVGDVAFVIDTDGQAAAGTGALKVGRVHAAPPAKEQTRGDQAPAPGDLASGGLQQHVRGEMRRPAQDKPGMLEDALEEAVSETTPRAAPSRGALVSMPPREDTPRKPAPAAPSIRRMARDLGVDINQVTGTGPGGRISADDVKAHVKKVLSSGGPRPAVGEPSASITRPPLPDFTRWGEIERKPMRPVRRKTAEHLWNAWVTIPHVTQTDKADITQLEALRTRYVKRAESAGGKLTITAIVLKVVAAALKQFPQVNASVDMAAEEVVYKRYVHIGVAVDTDRGLLVPVIRDVDRKSIVELSIELAQAAERARAGKTSLDEMQGGCFTITNLGGFGGQYFTPIVNHPEVAILGVSRAQMEPVWNGSAFEPRLMLPLSLSYDHRLVDGADGIRFLRWVVEALEEPFLLSL